ncbi:MAG: metallophosphoesterase [Endomicrobia bacterium]|nr:metallophosphoesterase [Endomicrobiia bacterium]
MNKYVYKLFNIILYIVFLFLAEHSHGENEPLSYSSIFVQEEVVYPYNFVVFGDTRKAHPVEKIVLKNVEYCKSLILKKIFEAKPLFVINTGDLVLNGSSLKDWIEFDKGNDIFKKNNIGYFPVLGNHEYKGNKTECLKNYFRFFPYLNKQKWYSFVYGNSCFIILDSNFDKLDVSEIEQQKQWLGKTLTRCENSAKILFVFIFLHHPPFTNSKIHRPNKFVQEHFVPVFDKFNKVKFIFCAHHHSYERFKVKGKNYVVTGGGGAPLMEELEPKNWRYYDEYGINKPRKTHFCVLTVWEDKIQFKTLHICPDRFIWQEGDFLEIYYR